MKIQSYLSFNGNCQEAFNFYQKIFGGEIINKETYENKEVDIPDHYRNKLQHAELKGKGFHFMGYDASPDTPLTSGTNIQMSVDVETKSEVDEIFDALSKSGRVHTPLQETSWNAYYGRCSDQYNIDWMINCKL